MHGAERAAAFAEALLGRLSAERAPLGTGDGPPVPSVGEVLELRARAAGLASPVGRTASATDSCRLIRSADGWLAVNLPRTDDLDLLPAWLGLSPGSAPGGGPPWSAIEQAVSRQPTASVVEQGQLLGLAVAAVSTGLDPAGEDEQLRARGTGDPTTPWIVRRVGPQLAPSAGGTGSPLVVDLSSLWAGPLCGRLLADAGMRVVKVESTTRPDGARGGPPAVFEWLNATKEHVALPLATAEGRQELRALLAGADVVIEGSRPRALHQMGIDPDEVVAGRAGAVWVAVTAYGRTGPWSNRVGFGDDCAAAGGLVERRSDGSPTFAGDAVADPLTGLLAAVLALAARRAGGGVVVDVSLREVARSAAAGAGGAVAVVDLGAAVGR